MPPPDRVFGARFCPPPPFDVWTPALPLVGIDAPLFIPPDIHTVHHNNRAIQPVLPWQTADTKICAPPPPPDTEALCQPPPPPLQLPPTPCTVMNRRRGAALPSALLQQSTHPGFPMGSQGLHAVLMMAVSSAVSISVKLVQCECPLSKELVLEAF